MSPAGIRTDTKGTTVFRMQVSPSVMKGILAGLVKPNFVMVC